MIGLQSLYLKFCDSSKGFGDQGRQSPADATSLVPVSKLIAACTYEFLSISPSIDLKQCLIKKINCSL